MKSVILGLLAETNLHPGVGQVVGAVDLPVAREKTTGYPVIVGSSLKGALRDRAEQVWGIEDTKVKRIFGEQDNAGTVAVTDARLLLLPLRSLSGHYKWVTCPYLLERYQRDLKLAGRVRDFPLHRPENGQAVMSQGQGRLFLEELSFDVVVADLTPVVEAIIPLIRHTSVQERLTGGLVVVSDDEFVYFARYGLVVNARNVLDDNSKTSKNLWYEETLPPDSLFYAMLFARSGQDDSLDNLAEVFQARPYLQVGGNETVGQGWCAISWLTSGGEVQ
jgi:CRISPR-associated protein Cmr4